MEVTSNASLTNKKYRLEFGRKTVDFESAVKQLGSERRAAKHTGIPRSTYQHLHDREKRFDLSEVTLHFFRTSDGVHFLHRLTLSIEFVISHICGSGIGAIQKVYELSQLDKIIATSDGSLCDRLQRLEDSIVEFGEIQFDHLSKNMPKKPIACALDETFPSDICLVGMEPVSNFILTEKFSQKRDSETWEQAMQGVLSTLPVNVVQVVSDEARALIKYCRDHLGAHHSPDLFHVQQEASKATSAPMRSRLKSAQSGYDEATQVLQSIWEEKREVEALKVKPVGRPVNYEQRLDDYAQIHREHLDQLAATAHQKQSIQEANKGIGDDYHPFDIDNGSPKTPDHLKTELDERFDKIQTHAIDAELSDNSHKKLNKARKVTSSMVATLSFFWSWVEVEMRHQKVKYLQHQELEVMYHHTLFSLIKGKSVWERLSTNI